MHSSWTYQHLTNGLKHSPQFYHYGKLRAADRHAIFLNELVFMSKEKKNILQSVSRRRTELHAEFPELGLCLTSGERRVQLLVEEPLLPVLLLLSDIALFRLNLAQHGADSAL